MTSCVIPIRNVPVPISVIVSAMLLGLFTIVTGTSDVLNLQPPHPSGVLIPGVGGHEGPVIEPL